MFTKQFIMADFTQIKQEPVDIKNDFDLANDYEIRCQNLSSTGTLEPVANTIIIQIKKEEQVKQEDEPEYIRYNMSDATNVSVTDDTYTCLICYKTYGSKRQLQRHIHGCHSLSHNHEQHRIQFECDICHKRFTRNGTLMVHMYLHTGEKPHECDVCHKRFIQRSDVTRHMVMHTGDKRHECDICHKQFTQKSSLTKHRHSHKRNVRLVEMERPYECNVCHKRFSAYSTLTAHYRTHIDIPKGDYHCDICHKRFCKKKYLNAHMRTHTGEKPFNCDICHKRFTVSHSLKRHHRRHGGDNNECNVCLKRCFNKSHLTLHMRIHTSVISAINSSLRNTP